MRNGKKITLTVLALLVAVLLTGCQGRDDSAGSGEQMETCTVAIRCDTILDNWDDLAPDKAELVPADGVLLANTTVAFTQGESALDALKRVCEEKEIHMDFSTTPGTGVAYLKGIGNLYEFDCGERSGWLYHVNSQSPDVGCSDYQLQPGDTVEFLYSCNWGEDLG